MENEQVNYHDRPELSASEIKLFINDPISWWHIYKVRDWPKPEPTPSMQFGTLVHDIIANRGEPSFAIRPDGLDMRTKAGKEWKESLGIAPVVSQCDANSIMQIWRHISSNRWLMSAIDQAKTEQEMFWDDPDFGQCRCKIDLFNTDILLDWKTTSKLSERQFGFEIVDRGYDLQMAFYRRGVDATYNTIPDCFIVPICTIGGYQVSIYKLEPEWLDDAEARLYLAHENMCTFDLDTYLNTVPKLLRQPNSSKLNMELV